MSQLHIPVSCWREPRLPGESPPTKDSRFIVESKHPIPDIILQAKSQPTNPPQKENVVVRYQTDPTLKLTVDSLSKHVDSLQIQLKELRDKVNPLVALMEDVKLTNLKVDAIAKTVTDLSNNLNPLIPIMRRMLDKNTDQSRSEDDVDSPAFSPINTNPTSPAVSEEPAVITTPPDSNFSLSSKSVTVRYKILGPSKIYQYDEYAKNNPMELQGIKKSKLEEFKANIRIINPSIVLLSETHWNKNLNLNFSSYNIIRSDREDSYGGVTILIKKILSSPPCNGIFVPKSNA